MVNLNYTSLSKLVHHSNFEQWIAFQFGIPRLLLNQFVDAESLIQIFVTTGAVVHEVSNFETSFMLRVFLPDCVLVIFKCHLPVYVEALFFSVTFLVELKWG